MRYRTVVSLGVAVSLVAVSATTAAWAGTGRHGRGRHHRPPVATASPSPVGGPSRSAPAGPGPSASAGRTAASSATTSPAAPGTAVPAGRLFFDDFTYTGPGDPQLGRHGWSVRTAAGGPGMSGATWSASAVSFPADPATAGNTLLQLRASTAGSAQSTVQAEVVTAAQKFLAGTYAARVHLTDAPATGPDGDQVNQTFFTITDLRYDDDPGYSELDFEYLPNGGWGQTAPTMHNSSYYTYHERPSWGADYVTHPTTGSLQGWHDLVVQVGGGTVTYFIDGRKVFASDGKYYPRRAMAIDFNEWFIEGGLAAGTASRSYDQRVDWVYHVADQVVDPRQMVSQAGALRAAKVTFRDTM